MSKRNYKNRGKNHRRSYRRCGPTAQVLVDAALDLLAALALTIALALVTPIPGDDSVIAVALAVAGLDLLLRTSLRRLPGVAIRAIVDLVRPAQQEEKAPTPAQRDKPEVVLAPEPAPAE